MEKICWTIEAGDRPIDLDAREKERERGRKKKKKGSENR